MDSNNNHNPPERSVPKIDIDESGYPSLEDAPELLKELEAFQTSKLFGYIIARNNLEFNRALTVVLDFELEDDSSLTNREAVIGELRVRRTLISQISGDLHEKLTELLTQHEEDNEN